MDLPSTPALVTGANRGLGRSLVTALLDRGATRIYAAARNPHDVSQDTRVRPLRLDLTDQTQVEAAAAEAGAIGLLVNNAGTAAFASLLDAPREAIERELATNALGTLDLIRAVVPRMPNGGVIVNVLSLLSLAPVPGMAGYSASKAAAHSMTQALRSELAGRGIRVVGVYPAGLDTDMLAGFDVPKAAPDAVAATIVDRVLAGDVDIYPEAVSQQMSTIWLSDPKRFEREFAA